MQFLGCTSPTSNVACALWLRYWAVQIQNVCVVSEGAPHITWCGMLRWGALPWPERRRKRRQDAASQARVPCSGACFMLQIIFCRFRHPGWKVCLFLCPRCLVRLLCVTCSFRHTPYFFELEFPMYEECVLQTATLLVLIIVTQVCVAQPSTLKCEGLADFKNRHAGWKLKL